MDLSPQQLEQFDRDGFLVFPNLFSKAEVAVLAKTQPRVSDVLMRHARDINADMVVMGAYGHSRFREAILGGATRNILESADLPVFMAH